GAASTAASSTATGMGGAGGAPTCTEDPSLCSGPTPVCHEGSCVECAPGDDALCGGETPYCDAQTLSCVPCRYHAHCPDSACNPFTGACLSATPQTVGPGGDYPSIVEAITNGVGSGEEAVFVVSPDTGAYQGAHVVSDMKVIALLGQNGRPVANDLNLPTFTVANGATLLLEGIDLAGNLNSRALQVDGRLALDRVEVALNSGGGIAASSTAELLVRNSVVAGNGTGNADAVALVGSTATFLYSSLSGVSDAPSAAVNCSGGHSLTVRNSILLKR